MGGGEKIWFSAHRPLKSYLLTLTSADDLFDKGLQAIPHGTSDARYKQILKGNFSALVPSRRYDEGLLCCGDIEFEEPKETHSAEAPGLTSSQVDAAGPVEDHPSDNDELCDEEMEDEAWWLGHLEEALFDKEDLTMAQPLVDMQVPVAPGRAASSGDTARPPLAKAAASTAEAASSSTPAATGVYTGEDR